MAATIETLTGPALVQDFIEGYRLSQDIIIHSEAAIASQGIMLSRFQEQGMPEELDGVVVEKCRESLRSQAEAATKQVELDVVAQRAARYMGAHIIVERVDEDCSPFRGYTRSLGGAYKPYQSWRTGVIEAIDGTVAGIDVAKSTLRIEPKPTGSLRNLWQWSNDAFFDVTMVRGSRTEPYVSVDLLDLPTER